MWQKYQDIRNFLVKMEKIADFIMKPGTILSIISLAVLSLQIIVRYPHWVILISTCIYLWVVCNASSRIDVLCRVAKTSDEETHATKTSDEETRDEDEYVLIEETRVAKTSDEETRVAKTSDEETRVAKTSDEETRTAKTSDEETRDEDEYVLIEETRNEDEYVVISPDDNKYPDEFVRGFMLVPLSE